MTTSGLRVEFRLQPTSELSRIQSVTDGEDVELDNAIYAGEGRWYQHLTVRTELDAEALRDRIVSSDAAASVELAPAEFDDVTYYLLAFVEEPDPFVVTTVTEVEAIPHRVRLADGQLTVTASVEDWPHLKRVADHLETNYREFELLSTTQAETRGFPLGTDLVKHAVHGKMTEGHLALLETAYRQGYFDVPQAVTATELAETVGTSQSTLSEQLRNAQSALLAVLFGNR